MEPKRIHGFSCVLSQRETKIHVGGQKNHVGIVSDASRNPRRFLSLRVFFNLCLVWSKKVSLASTRGLQTVDWPCLLAIEFSLNCLIVSTWASIDLISLSWLDMEDISLTWTFKVEISAE